MPGSSSASGSGRVTLSTSPLVGFPPNALDGERPLPPLQGVPAAFLAQLGELRAAMGHARWANPCTAACTVG